MPIIGGKLLKPRSLENMKYYAPQPFSQGFEGYWMHPLLCMVETFCFLHKTVLFICKMHHFYRMLNLSIFHRTSQVWCFTQGLGMVRCWEGLCFSLYTRVATELATCGISSVNKLYDIPDEGGSSSGDKREMNMTLTKWQILPKGVFLLGPL